jgi:hypothetical protein
MESRLILACILSAPLALIGLGGAFVAIRVWRDYRRGIQR